MRDLIIGIVLLILSATMLTGMFAYSIQHDCSEYPFLQSHVFGKRVPVETICKLAGY